MPLDEISIENSVSKEESKKKNVFSISNDKTGLKILLLAASESEMLEWVDAITGATRESNSEQEYCSSIFSFF